MIPTPTQTPAGLGFWRRCLLPWLFVFVAVAVAERLPRLHAARPYVAPVLMLYLPLWLERREGAADGGLGWGNRAGWLAAVISGVVVLGGFYVVTTQLLWGPWQTPAAGWGARLLSEVAFAALPEEVFFRGYLQPRAEQRFAGRAWRLGPVTVTAGNAWTAVLFGVLHLAATPRPERLAVFFPGLWFGWLRTRSQSVWPGVIVHALSNVFMAAAQGL